MDIENNYTVNSKNIEDFQVFSNFINKKDSFIEHLKEMQIWEDIDESYANFFLKEFIKNEQADFCSKYSNDALDDIYNSIYYLGLLLSYSNRERHVCIYLKDAQDAKTILTEILELVAIKNDKQHNYYSLYRAELNILLDTYLVSINADGDLVLKSNVDLDKSTDAHILDLIKQNGGKNKFKEAFAKIPSYLKVLNMIKSPSFRALLNQANLLDCIEDFDFKNDLNKSIFELKKILVWSNNSYYLCRYFWYEIVIAYLKNNVKAKAIGNIEQVKIWLNDLFDPKFNVKIRGTDTPEINWQKIAVAGALSSNFAVITGGPGTGKTTSVANLIGILTLQENKKLNIALAAPTGKAADRVKESLANTLNDKYINDKVFLTITDEETKVTTKQTIGELYKGIKASTIHSLLKTNPSTTISKFNQKNKLPYDVVILDEASMIDLGFFYKVLMAIDFTKTRLICLGDKDQLASVDTGAVLGDICSVLGASKNDLSEEFNSALKIAEDEIVNITGYSKTQMAQSYKRYSQNTLADDLIVYLAPGINTLLHSYRFDAQGGIGEIAAKVNNGSYNIVEFNEDKTSNQGEDGKKIVHLNLDGKVLNDKSKFYATYKPFYKNNYLDSLSKEKLGISCKQENSNDNELNKVQVLKEQYTVNLTPALVKDLFTTFNKTRILSPNNEGDWSVSDINTKFTKFALEDMKKAFPEFATYFSEQWFIGLPYMITKNEESLGINNGDIGICTFDRNMSKALLFENGRTLPLSILPNIIPAFALTIHKSQGSEFEHTMVVIPNKTDKILCKELLYTGITRAKKRLTIVGDKDVINKGLKRSNIRRSGLRYRLYGFVFSFYL